MRTILRLVRWFGKALNRDGIGWAGFWGMAAAAFLFGAFLDCSQTALRVNSANGKVRDLHRQAVHYGFMKIWRTPDGKTVYRWKKDERGE